MENPDRYAKQKNARKDYVALAKVPGAAGICLRKLSVAQVTFVSCGISSIIPLKIYEEIGSPGLMEHIPPFALGARMCNALVRKWEVAFQVRQPTECIFEQGDFGQGKYRDLMREEGQSDPIFRK
jgi:hypothetical protein